VHPTSPAIFADFKTTILPYGASDTNLCILHHQPFLHHQDLNIPFLVEIASLFPRNPSCCGLEWFVVMTFLIEVYTAQFEEL
jgi:hypothetical protein